MKALPVVYVVEAEGFDDEARHIPNAQGREMAGGSALTLCGWVDVVYREEADAAPTCGACLRIVRYCKALPAP